VLISYTLESGEAASIVLDASITELHEAEAEVTEDQVETGSPISDHVRPLQRKIGIEGFVSNHPIEVPASNMQGITGAVERVEFPGGLGGANVLRFSGDFDRVRAVEEELDRLRTGGILCTLSTSLRVYENTVLRSFAVKRDATSGNALPVSLSFVQIRIAEVRTVPVPSIPRAARRAARGAQNPTPTEEATAEGSGNDSLFSRLTGMGIRAR
jgi:hypothetical protein